MLNTALRTAERIIFRGLRPLLRGGRPRYHRSLLMERYCQGKGAEIGAFATPSHVPFGSSSIYIDRVPASHWSDDPEYAGIKLVDPDILDDGSRLSKVESSSLDYLVASHVLEHVDDPVSALKNWIRVVKPGGHVVVIVPDKRFTFDSPREVTTTAEMIADHLEGPRNEPHYREVAEKCMGLTSDADIQAFVDKAEPAIHFHTFTMESFLAFLVEAKTRFDLPFEIVSSHLNVAEDVAVLKVVAED